ncbi:MAG: 3-oxoacyl-ACP reductase FabG [Ruthenibacterium sp.]
MGKTVLITGASSGIGAACAGAFANAGWNVAVCYRTHREQAETLCAQFAQNAQFAKNAQLSQAACAAQTTYGTAQPFYVDVTDEASVADLFAAAQKSFGGVDVLINNAGVARQVLFTDMSADEWDAMFAVHVRGTFLCCKAALPYMLHQKRGSILNISSMWGQVGASCEVAYSAAKAAVIGLTKALAKEEGPSGITVNCIAPGVVETPMLAGFSAQDKAELANETPLCRIGMPQDIANAALFLASDAAAFITGQVLGVNGGFVI